MRQEQGTSTGDPSTFEQLGLWLGIIAPVLIVGGFFAVDEGGTELSGSVPDIVAHLAGLHGRMVIGSLIGILGGLALMGFTASLNVHLGGQGARQEWLGSMGFGFGVIIAIGAIVRGSFRLAIASIVSSELPPSEMVPLWAFDSAGAILAWGAVGLVATMSIGAFADDLLPKALAGVGFMLVAGTVALAPTDHGGVSLTLLLWLIATAGVLIQRSHRPAGAASASS